MTNAQMYAEKWFAILAYCKSDKVDAKEFRQMHDEYAKRWAKQSLEEQGSICNIIHEGLKS